MTELQERMLPLYESKLLHQFDHRWATYDADGSTRDVTDEEKADRTFEVMPRYWVPESAVQDSIESRWDEPWVLVWRGIARSTDIRTAIATATDGIAGGGNYDYFLPTCPPNTSLLAVGALNSFVFDYVARQKLTGMHLQFSLMSQLAAPAPSKLAGQLSWSRASGTAWFGSRIGELIYTSDALAPVADALGCSGAPFRWDPERRAFVRAEIDAAFFHLYGVAHDDVDYIMETFPIVKRRDEEKHGHFRTKALILDVYRKMATAIATGVPYETILSPPAADPRVAHPPSTERPVRQVVETT